MVTEEPERLSAKNKRSPCKRGPPDDPQDDGEPLFVFVELAVLYSGNGAHDGLAFALRARWLVASVDDGLIAGVENVTCMHGVLVSVTR